MSSGRLVDQTLLFRRRRRTQRRSNDAKTGLRDPQDLKESQGREHCDERGAVRGGRGAVASFGVVAALEAALHVPDEGGGGKTGIGVSYFLKRHRRALTWGGGGAGVSKSLDLIREA